jgi:hypothetical protein
MIDDTKRVLEAPARRQRHHEVDIEPHAHPGEPRQVVSSDHEVCQHEPQPASRRTSRHAREGHGC